MLRLELLESRISPSVTLAPPFTSNMVLQRDQPIRVWGSALPTENVVVSLAGEVGSAQADNTGHWLVTLPALYGGGTAYSLTAVGQNRITLSNILIGDVWLAGGQSNMVFPLSADVNGDNAANDPMFRFYSPYWGWVNNSPAVAGQMTAVGYYFAQQMERDNPGIPVGIMDVAVNGTSITSWIPRSAMENDPNLWPDLPIIESQPALATENPTSVPGDLFNSDVLPLAPLSISGVIWYQGEGDRNIPDIYGQLLPLLALSWRLYFQQDFPFVYVQLADSGISWQSLQSVQFDDLASIPDSSMVVSADGPVAIHPSDKQFIGVRLAKAAENLLYDRNNVLSPMPTDWHVSGDEVIVDFSNSEGLNLTSDLGFEVEDSSQNWVAVPATIQNGAVVLAAAGLHPIGVRYGWTANSALTLYNAAGLPAPVFSLPSIISVPPMLPPVSGPSPVSTSNSAPDTPPPSAGAYTTFATNSAPLTTSNRVIAHWRFNPVIAHTSNNVVLPGLPSWGGWNATTIQTQATTSDAANAIASGDPVAAELSDDEAWESTMGWIWLAPPNAFSGGNSDNAIPGGFSNVDVQKSTATWTPMTPSKTVAVAIDGINGPFAQVGVWPLTTSWTVLTPATNEELDLGDELNRSTTTAPGAGAEELPLLIPDALHRPEFYFQAAFFDDRELNRLSTSLCRIDNH